jgi:predicted RNA binding protein YcfA (HicA-like mRNA interferase family)
LIGVQLPSCAVMVDAERCLQLVRQHLPPVAKIAAFFVLLWRLFCDHMARRLHNWNYRNVTDFLKSRGFNFYKELGGSHQAWIKKGCSGAPNKVVEINFTHRAYPPGTLKTIIRQSGIAENEWIAWTRS